MRYIRIKGPVAYVQLSRGFEAIIDAEDVSLIEKDAWHVLPIDDRHYARGAKSKTYMHRVIMGIPKGMDVDHINHNGLDNRRSNLRVVTRSQNMMNRTGANSNSTTGIRGVYIHHTFKRDRKKASSKTELWSYNARYMIDGRSYTKNFPLTPEGLADAEKWVKEMRRLKMGVP